MPQDLTIGQVLEFLFGPFGTLFLALLIIYTGSKKIWVFGWYANEINKRNERLEKRIDSISHESRAITSVAEKTATLAERKTEAYSE